MIYFRPLERRKLRIHFYDSRVTDDDYHMFTWEICRFWILNRVLDAKWTLECARAKFIRSGIPWNFTFANLLVTNYNSTQNRSQSSTKVFRKYVISFILMTGWFTSVTHQNRYWEVDGLGSWPNLINFTWKIIWKYITLNQSEYIYFKFHTNCSNRAK